MCYIIFTFFLLNTTIANSCKENITYMSINSSNVILPGYREGKTNIDPEDQEETAVEMNKNRCLEREQFELRIQVSVLNVVPCNAGDKVVLYIDLQIPDNPVPFPNDIKINIPVIRERNISDLFIKETS